MTSGAGDGSRRRGRRGNGTTSYLRHDQLGMDGHPAASLPPLDSGLYEPGVPRRWVDTPFTYQVEVTCPWCYRTLRRISCRDPFMMPGHPRVRVVPLEQTVDRYERHMNCGGANETEAKVDAAIARSRETGQCVKVRAVKILPRREDTTLMKLVREQSGTRRIMRKKG